MEFLKNNKMMKMTALVGIALATSSCNLKDQISGTASKGKNAVAIKTKSCSSFTTGSQADGENKVIQPTGTYNFNLYYKGPSSQLSFWEDKMVNENVTFDFKPLTLHLFDGSNAELKKISCTENKINALLCIERMEAISKMIKEAKASAGARRAAVSEGKGFTYKCTQEFVDGKITELKRIN